MSDEIDPDLYQRLCDREPVAPSEFCELYLPLLMADRRWLLAGIRDEHMITDAAIRAVLSVAEHPEQYDPAQSKIMGYLRMSAKRDLINLLNAESRRSGRTVSIEAVDLPESAGNERREAPDLPGGVSPEFLMRKLDDALPIPQDREAVRLMLDGVRSTEDYARVYGLSGLSVQDQRKQVKRHKDRLDKVMKRIGLRFRDGG
jgi:RNA polymerase sigma-70 factor (ECF subfamily)